jgi:hypothetical protein
MTNGLSKEAAEALFNVGTNRQGATIAHNTPAVVVAELRTAGLIGFNLGLTRRGTIARERISNALLDAAFG